MTAVAPGGPAPLVTVIVPTHDHADTIDLALDSVLAQSIEDIEVVVIGDGASDGVIAALERYPDDPRLRMIFRPKSRGRCEETRHELLMGARSTFVAYLGDDDLMLPDHLTHMIELLDRADFAHPFPIGISSEGDAFWYGTDLALPDCRDWHQHPERNGVSLSGVVHRLSAYRKLPLGWRPAPPGRWSDHYMWQQWFATPGFTYRCGERTTMLKFDAAWRQGISGSARRAELLAWRERAAAPGFPAELAGLTDDAVRRFGIKTQLELARVTDAAIAHQADTTRALSGLTGEVERLTALVAQHAEVVPELMGEVERLTALVAQHAEAVPELTGTIDRLTAQLAAADVELRAVTSERDLARGQRDEMAATKTWRVHNRVTTSAPLRALLRRRDRR